MPFHLRTYPELAPHPALARNSPITAVFLTSADVDHVLGLLSLREGGPLHIHATSAIERATGILGVTSVLQSFCGVVWHHPPGGLATLLGNDGQESSLRVRVLPLSTHAPRYAGKNSPAGVYTTALQFLDEQTGAMLLVAPGVEVWSDILQEAAKESTGILMDGTFWSEDELRLIQPGARGASEMGHLPIEDGTLPLLSDLHGRRRVYVHINNTNPIFMPDSPERAAVEDAGITVGQDGMSFEL